MLDLELKVLSSMKNTQGTVSSNEEIDTWIKERNKNTVVNIKKIPFAESKFWFFDEFGNIRNKNNSFFSIHGYQVFENGQLIHEQPIIIQKEIGYLGILCKEINGELNFLMQAKIEPGNINKIQISPTIQATKSNFTQKHGGKKPKYLEYFLEADKYEIIVDQIQSEQSSRFYKKRNRNIIIYLKDNDVLVDKNFKWMTLGQIKRLLRMDNLVNMDTRTVISCLPFLSSIHKSDLEKFNSSLISSMYFESYNEIPRVYNYINDVKMFNDNKVKFVPLESLQSWEINENEIISNGAYDFKVIMCDIEIEGREVVHWSQPLFQATGKALFGLLTCKEQGVQKFLVQCKKEVGAFDTIELAPTVQLEASEIECTNNSIDLQFLNLIQMKENVLYDVCLSEEGGRFYHEENRNVIIEVEKDQICFVEGDGYFWVSYRTLNLLVQVNNCLNIQLRNLLSLLEV